MDIEEIPKPPGCMPVLGHVVPLVRGPLEFLRALPEYGDLVRLRLGRMDAIVACTPDLNQSLLVDDRTFDKGGAIWDRGREVVGNGLGSCPHADHRSQRRLIQPAFTDARVKEYSSTVADLVPSLVEGWGTGDRIDVLGQSTLLMMKAVFRAIFSDSIPDAELAQAIDDIASVVQGVYLRAVIPGMDKLPLPMNRRHRAAHDRLRSTLRSLIARRGSAPAGIRDLMSELMAAGRRPSPHGELDLREVEDQVVTFVLAAIDTTSVTVTWALHLLATRPELQQEIYQEIRSTAAGAPQVDDLAGLNLTRYAVKETLRMYPPGWLFSRVTTSTATLGGYRIPPGVTVVCSPYVVHHRADIYSAPEEFNPHRWNPEKHQQPPRNAFIAFGHGARKCIGDVFGMNVAMLILANALARWRFEPSTNYKVGHKLGFVLTPVGVELSTKPRT